MNVVNKALQKRSGPVEVRLVDWFYQLEPSMLTLYDPFLTARKNYSLGLFIGLLISSHFEPANKLRTLSFTIIIELFWHTVAFHESRFFVRWSSYCVCLTLVCFAIVWFVCAFDELCLAV